MNQTETLDEVRSGHSNDRGNTMKAVTVTRIAAPACLALLLHATTTNAAETHITPGSVESTVQVLDAPAAGDEHRLWNQGNLEDLAGNGSGLIVQGSGAGRVIVDNEAVIRGMVDFSAVSGGLTFNNEAGASWTVYAPASGLQMTFGGSGDDWLNNAQGGTVSISHEYFSEPMAIDFGAGEDGIDNAGAMSIDAHLRGLETIRNSGSLWLESAEGIQEIDNDGTVNIGGYIVVTDGGHIRNTGTLALRGYDISTGVAATIDASGLARFENAGVVSLLSSIPVYTNRLIIDGAEFVGLAGSRFDLEAVFADTAQGGCELAAVGSADCVSIRGGSTSGQTSIYVRSDLGRKGAGFLREGLVVVDVRGGESAAGHFVLDPSSPGFEADAPFGGGIRADEMFTFHLMFDEATTTHRLMGIPDTLTQVLGVMPTVAQNLWRTAEQSSVARLTELRDRQPGGGLWFRAGRADTDGKASVGYSLLGNHSAMQVRHEQEDSAYVMGYDLVGDEADTRYGIGVSLGKVGSDFRVRGTRTGAEIEALAFSLYGSYQRGAVFIDLSGSGYWGDMTGRVELSQNDYAVRANVDAIGGRAEAGYRLSVGERLVIEPLLSVVYTRSAVGTVQHLSGNANNAVAFESAASLRGGIGARAAMGLELLGLDVRLSLTARGWEEFKGEVDAYVRTIRDPFPFSSTMDGRYTEVDAAIGLGSANGMFSGQLALGNRSGEGQNGTTASMSVRYHW